MEVAVKNENPAPNANANAPLPQRNQKPQGQQGPQIGNEPAEKKPRFSDINPNQNQNQGGGPGGFQQRRNNNRMNNNRNNMNRNNPQQNIKPEVSFFLS